MRFRPTTLLLPVLLALAGCNLTLQSESGAEATQQQTCSGALTYGGCVTGEVRREINDRGREVEVHGYHRALLRRGDVVRATLTVTDGDLNPGLALKSPKYSLAVKHDSVVPRSDTVEKTWTIRSTGFYTFVGFPWSHRGNGHYRIDLSCVAGPCLQGQVMDAEIAGACIGQARDCALAELDDSPLDGSTVPSLFESCLRGDDMPALCGGACENGVCAETVNRLRNFAGRGPDCIEQIQNCIDDCVPHNTTSAAITDLAGAPDMMCWAAGNRASCAAFGAGLEVCRDPLGIAGEAGREGRRDPSEGYAVGSEAWCNATCVVREGDALNELCVERCDPLQNADDEESPDPANAEAAE